MVDMGMNIKNERVHELAKQAAKVTGLSQTSAVEKGLRMLLAEHGADEGTERQRKIDAMRAIGLLWEPAREGAIAEVEDLYDPETGLPA